MLFVTEAAPDGRPRVGILFDPDNLDAAAAELEARYAAQRASEHAPTPNKAWAMSRRTHETAERAGVEALRPFATDDVVIEDRRLGLGARLVGKDELLAGYGVVYDPATYDGLDAQLISTRGEHLCLSRRVLKIKNGYEAEVLVVSEINDYDQWVAIVLFDPDDLTTALEELDRRWSASNETR